MVVFNRLVAFKVSALTDKVKRYFREASSRAISFKEDGLMERRHECFADMPRSWFSASSKVVETLIWLVLSCRETFNMYL